VEAVKGLAFLNTLVCDSQYIYW